MSANVRRQNKEIEQLINKSQKNVNDYHRTINEKSDIIISLQDQLDKAQKKMRNYMEDSSSHLKGKITMNSENFATEQLKNQVSKYIFL